MSSWGARREGSSAKLPVPAGAEEEARLSFPSTWQKQGRDAWALKGSLLPPPSPLVAQEEPLDSSAPHRYHLLVSWVTWAGQGTKAHAKFSPVLYYLAPVLGIMGLWAPHWGQSWQVKDLFLKRT